MSIALPKHLLSVEHKKFRKKKKKIFHFKFQNIPKIGHQAKINLCLQMTK
jgi:hypothetical protein